MSLVGYRTHSITLRAANMRRGVLVNSAVCRRFVFFRGIREISIAKAREWIKIDSELKCRKEYAGADSAAPARRREIHKLGKDEKHESNANTISAQESAVADSRGGHGGELAAHLGLRVG